MIKKVKWFLFSLVLSLSVYFGSSFTEDYFEVSKNLDIFATLFRELNIYYVDDTKPGELMKTGINAMLESLDPYTNFIPESDIEDYKFMATGQYGGIGATVREIGDKIVISEPYENSPAIKAGLRAGDIIISVNGILVGNKKYDDISKLLKGQPGTPVKIVVQHFGEDKQTEYTLNREEINVKDVPYYGMLNNETGYIKLTGFTHEASKEVREAFRKLKVEKGCKSLVLDLRGNPGGLLLQAVDIVNVFTEKGQIIATTKGKIKEWEFTYKAVNNPEDLEMPVVVLVDRNSASASEIVSGSLQDLDRAVVIGERTYGKGLVQDTRNLSYNCKLKVTVAKYYIPSGRCIQALDYTHRRQDGSVEKVADSLTTAFKTKHGRIVYDGAGVFPDVSVNDELLSEISVSLLNKNIFFNYANVYFLKNPTLNVSAKDFQLSDKDYEDFVDFVSKYNYEYTTNSEEKLKEFFRIAEDEQYAEDIKSEYLSLQTKIKSRKKEDMNKFKLQIKELLEDEIISRYYFQSGRLEASLKYDACVKEALAIISDKNRYQSILSKIETPKRPFNPNKKF